MKVLQVVGIGFLFFIFQNNVKIVVLIEIFLVDIFVIFFTFLIAKVIILKKLTQHACFNFIVFAHKNLKTELTILTKYLVAYIYIFQFLVYLNNKKEIILLKVS